MFIQIIIPGWMFGILICFSAWFVVIITFIFFCELQKVDTKKFKFLYCKKQIKKGHRRCPFSFEE